MTKTKIMQFKFLKYLGVFISPIVIFICLNLGGWFTWGGLIYFETSDDDLYGWDGTIDGKPAENGNYIIVVRATTFQGKLIEFNGPITLLK